MPRPHGHECYRRNVCFECFGRLRARRADSYSEIMYDDGRQAFAAPVCTLCRLIHWEMMMAKSKPLDFEARIEAMRAKAATGGYAVAQYHKVKEVDDEFVERIYVIRLDGSMVTRQVICDTRRSFNSFRGDGWHAHETPSIPFKNIRSYCKQVDEQLTKLGYERQF